MRFEHQYYVYILTNKQRGSLYIGVTNNLYQRVTQHRNKSISSFTARYNITKLVYFETYQFVQEAIVREKQMKKWNRDWKIQLIEQNNPNWRDYYETLHTGLM